MSAEIHHIAIGSKEGPVQLHYGFLGGPDFPVTPFGRSAEEVVELLDEDQMRCPREEFLEFMRASELKAELITENIQLMQRALESLAAGEEISSQQKRLLYETEHFLDDALSTTQKEYTELDASDELQQLIETEGLRDDAAAYISESPHYSLHTWLSDEIAECVYGDEASRQIYSLSNRNTEPLISTPAQRRVAAAYLRTKVTLAVGALYAAGVEGDDLAMQVAEVVQHIIE